MKFDIIDHQFQGKPGVRLFRVQHYLFVHNMIHSCLEDSDLLELKRGGLDNFREKFKDGVVYAFASVRWDEPRKTHVVTCLREVLGELILGDNQTFDYYGPKALTVIKT